MQKPTGLWYQCKYQYWSVLPEHYQVGTGQCHLLFQKEVYVTCAGLSGGKSYLGWFQEEIYVPVLLSGESVSYQSLFEWRRGLPALASSGSVRYLCWF